MISYWQIISSGLLPIQTYKKDCIVSVTSPTEEEKDVLKSTFQIPMILYKISWTLKSVLAWKLKTIELS